jgi:hypothetical protein
MPVHQPGRGRHDRRRRPGRDPQPHESGARAGLPYDEQRARRTAGVAQGGGGRGEGGDDGSDRVCGDGVSMYKALARPKA